MNSNFYKNSISNSLMAFFNKKIWKIKIFPSPSSNKEYPECDGIRGFAIILVYWFHYLQIFQIEIEDSSLWNLPKIIAFSGGYGVQLFFVLSAYLLFLPQYTKIMAGSTPQRISHFAIRRFLRITPLYYLTTILFIWFVDVGIPEADKLKHTLAHLFFIHIFFKETLASINSVAWSLGPEFIFYLILPFLLYIIFRIFRMWNPVIKKIAFFSLLIILSILATIHGLNPNMIISTFISFYLGIFAAIAVHHLSGTKTLNKKIIQWMSPLVILSIIIVHYYVFTENLKTGPSSIVTPVIYTEKFWLISILYALGVIVASQKDHILYPALSFYPFRLIGLFSYEIYLIHAFMIFWLSKQSLYTMIDNNHFLNGLLMFLIIMLFGGILHATISRPFIKISNLLIRKKPEQHIPIWMIILMISFVVVIVVPTALLI